MLVAAGLRRLGSAGGTAISNRQKAGSEYLGYQPGPGRLRRNRGSTKAARPGYRQERLDQDHRAAAGRPETARHLFAFEPDCPQRSPRLQRTTKGAKGPSTAGAGRKGGNDADD